jgi:hypothetical protein
MNPVALMCDGTLNSTAKSKIWVELVPADTRPVRDKQTYQ